jgi:hypothetical protein
MTALIGAVTGAPVDASAAAGIAAAAVVDPALIAALNNGESPAVLVQYRGKANLSAAFGINDSNARATYVYEALRNNADQAQSQSRTMLASQYHLDASAHDYTVLWINNSIAIQNMTPALLSSLQSDPNVASIREQRVIPLQKDDPLDAPWTPMDATASLTHIHVPEVWAEGYRGAGLVVANIDTGVRYTHHALVNQYRGNAGGGTFNHNFNWYDPYNHTATPRNSDPHGSHTMGTMIGDDGGTNQIGVAPEGKWIACIGFGFQGSGATDAGLLECGQWTIAPYPTNGTGTPDPTQHADVVNNSWGDCGRSYDTWYEDVIDGWIAAGIAPIFSNGNAPNCGYPNNPPLNTVGNPGRSGKVFGVGALSNATGVYANFSNKGPTDNDNPGLPTYPDPRGFPDLKPNVSAPGTNVFSASSAGDDSYFLDSGTSMAAPHTAGLVALMWSAAPCIKGDWGTTGTIVMSTATAIPVATGSPSDGPGNVPNQATGWGEINALAAVDAAVAHCGSGGTPVASVDPTSLSFSVDAGDTTTDTLTIGNTGTGTLNWTVTDSTSACTSPSDASWLSEAPTSGAVDGGDSADTTITLDASSLTAGAYSAHLCVASNDTQHALIDIPVSVVVTTGGTDPTASVAPTSLSFSLAAGASASNPLTIANVGGGSLTWTASDSEDCATPADVTWLSESPTSGSVAGGSSQNTSVTANASGLSAGSYSANVCFATNDAANPVVSVPVSLNVTGGGGDNGIILSGPLNHSIADNLFGTTLNVVTSAFDDTGPTDGDWDFNFYDISGFSFYTIETYDTQYVVDGSGNVVVMHVGDVVGPASTFSTNTGTGNVPSAPEWSAGTDGYAGVRFDCDGRLANPVPGNVCYGFIHITTTAGTGFPAFIADTGFDGDGNAITITGGAPGNDPAATVTPTSLDFTVASNATATQTLSIANAAGSDPLTYSIEARGTKQPKLIPHTALSKATKGQRRHLDQGKLIQQDALRHRVAPHLTRTPSQHHDTAPWAPVGPDGSTVFSVDDGSYENTIGLNNGNGGGNESFGAIWVNRFTATGALTIDSISIEWPSGTGIVPGMQPNLVVYYDASSSGDLTQVTRLGTDQLVTIAGTDAFETYTTSFSVPGAGDVYIGFVDAWALVDGGFEGIVSPAALDDSSSPGAAYVSGQSAADILTDLNDLANNDLTDSAANFGFPGNWLVRATGSGGSGGPCTGPIVSWLSATPASGSVAGGTSANVQVRADPAAGGLAAGDYSGELCITTNDPTQTLIAIPVSLTVTAVTPAACSGADEIFCNGFDPESAGTIVSGTINQAVADNADGSSFDFATGDYHPYDASIATDDINLYALDPGGLYVYWYGDQVPPEADGLTGGVLDDGGLDFAVLHAGDTVGPSSAVSAGSIPLTNWQGGADGYVGVVFWNEVTSQINYGYLHLTTQSPDGFPAEALDWAYDSSGAAITIP